ncbi:MAG: hypothetical protein ING36_15235 [Burkholderiales bacterium]|nr:hypothetical protein [Burkholderiales bacterium]
MIEHLSALQSSLDAHWVKHQAIAFNLATQNNPDVAKVRVSFKTALNEAGKKTIVAETSTLGDEARDAGFVAQQLVELNTNTLNYQLLLRGLSRELNILSTAVSDGRR